MWRTATLGILLPVLTAAGLGAYRHPIASGVSLAGAWVRPGPAEVADATSEPAAPVELEPVTVAVAAPGTPAQPGGDFDVTLSLYRTRYSSHGRYRGRAHNVERAAALLDGAVIPAGGRLSFNDRVGARDRRNGFRMAPVIDGGEIVQGMGGGVCQVASTLHATSLRAGLRIAEHQAHSRPSAYIPMGLDATVVYPEVDLVIENPHPFPIAVRASGVDHELVVELLGEHALDATIDIERRVLARTRFGERVVADPTLPAGHRIVQQQGIPGARVEVARRFVEHGETRVERTVVRYPANDRIVRVGTARSAATPASGPAVIAMR